MFDRKHLGLTAFLAVSAMFSAPAFAGGDCCKEGAKGGEVAQTPAEKPAEKKLDACPLSVCDAHQAKKTEAVLAKLTAAPVKRTADEEKAIAEAKKNLASACPMGSVMTKSIPSILEAVQAVTALDAVLAAGGKDLPADCKNAEGKCAFCVEAGPKMTDAAKEAMGVGMKALARAEKLAGPLAALAATYGGDTTKPAGMKVPSVDAFKTLAERTQKIAADMAGACKKAEAMPAEEKAKVEAAGKHLSTLAPEAFEQVCAGYGALFAELELASTAAKASAEACSFMKDEKWVATLSPNAKNALALFHARAMVVTALGKVSEASGMASKGNGCGENAKNGSCGTENASTAKKEEGCCGEAGAKPVSKP